MEASKMQLNLKRMITALAAVALVGTGSVLASPPTPLPAAPGDHCAAYLSGRASTLLGEIQEQAAGMQVHAETLGNFAWNPQYSWQSHAFYLDGVKGHINAVGERISEVQQIRNAVLPWQQQAIDQVAAHAAQVAASTEAAIAHLRENQDRLFVSEYRDHLTTIANSSEDMKQTVDKFLDYDKAQQKFQQLRNELELAGD
jgi:signal transduction histidine kinase